MCLVPQGEGVPGHGPAGAPLPHTAIYTFSKPLSFYEPNSGGLDEVQEYEVWELKLDTYKK